MLRQTRAALLGSDIGGFSDSRPAGAHGTGLPMVKSTHRLRLILISAIGVGLIYLGWPMLASLTRGLFGKNSDDIPVLVADHFIAPFQILKSSDAKVKFFPREFVPPGAMHAPTELLKEDGQALYSSIVGIPENQPLTRTLVNETGKNRGMSSLLRPGKVAISFKVDRDKSAGGWVKPGDTIAVFQKLPLDPLHGKSLRKTRLLLSAVEVLAVDHSHLGKELSEELKPEHSLESALQENEIHVLTVLTNTSDAAALVEAQEVGPLTVVLRPLGDELPWLPSTGGSLP